MPGGGAFSGTVDYDLGYDANGWDTAGFRRPDADYLDSQDTGHVSGSEPGGGHRRGNGRAGSHARATGTIQAEHALRPSPAPGPRGPGRPGGPGGPTGPHGPSGPRRGRVKVKGSWWRHWTLRKALGVLLSLVGAFIVLGALAVVMAYESTAVPTEAMAATSYVQSVVYSSDGTLIGRFGTTNRQMLSYNQIPPQIIDAVLAAEDRNFWNEGGISPTGIARAAYADLRGNDGSLQGGSTITQEFVRQYFVGIGTQQTFSRKIKEIFVAMKISKEKSKQWILQNYLNTIYLGEGAYGIQAAAETYFGEPVSKLSVAQDAVIAALIQQPSTYPLPQYRPELVARWRNYVLTGMVQMGTLSAETAATMKFPKLGDNVPQTYGPDVWDPYVMTMVYNELRQVYGLTQSQIYNGGYVIKTSIDDKKTAALYQAVSQNEATIDASSVPFESYMHVGAVLENPVNGEIDALYPGPGFTGAKYNGTGKVITAKECAQIDCYVNMAQNREQVGSSFKPYILAEAVKQGMNVQTSTLDGYNNLYIPPDSDPTAYATSNQADALSGWHEITNDDAGENRPYTPQIAMAASINTAYTDLWHTVAGDDGQNVVSMAQEFGVDTNAACISANCRTGKTVVYAMKNEAGLALGQASLTVIEQGSMLATLDDNGVYHDAHLITKISQNSVLTPIKITTYPVFSPNPTLNAAEDSQVQYAMSEDTNPSYGTAPVAAMSNGQEIIAKTGTTEKAQSAFFIGAIPSQALTVALFTSYQSQTLNGLGGNSQGGYGGTWPATIWHTYAENMFVPLGVEPFQPVSFTGATWNLVPPNLRQVAKPKKKSPSPQPTAQPSFPNPFPTSTCPPMDWTICGGNPQDPIGGGGGGGGGGGNTQTVSATPAAAVAGGFLALPGACLWVRRRMRKRGAGRG
jgi:membrane peptidoglycan carboxypeptidase